MTWLQTAVDGEYSEQTGGNNSYQDICNCQTLNFEAISWRFKNETSYPISNMSENFGCKDLKRSVEMEKVYICIFVTK